MAITRRAAVGFALATPAILTMPRAVRAQEAWPARPIRLVVPFPAGGITDIVARLAGEFVFARTGQRMIVDNVAGAGGNTGIALVAKAPADGYTLGLVATGNLAINPHLFVTMPFDALKDVVPVAALAEAPQVLVVHPSVPATDLRSFIAYGKANPGKLNYGSAGVGTTNHLAGDLFARMAGIEATHVPYRGAAPAITDLLGGQIQFLIVGAAPVIERIRNGSLRAMGIATANRIATLPDVPTIAEAGLPGYASTTWFGIVAPSGTPAAVVGRLNGLLRDFTADADTRQKFAASFFEPMSLTPDAFATLVREDHARWREIVKAAGVQPE